MSFLGSLHNKNQKNKSLMVSLVTFFKNARLVSMVSRLPSNRKKNKKPPTGLGAGTASRQGSQGAAETTAEGFWDLQFCFFFD